MLEWLTSRWWGVGVPGVINRNANPAVRSGPASNENGQDNGHPTERSGQAIVALLNQAADSAKATCEQVINTAGTLSIQLRAAEDKVKLLESELRHYQDRSSRAEKWLSRVYKEIEQNFFNAQNTRQPSRQ